jgi:hypothetical protein
MAGPSVATSGVQGRERNPQTQPKRSTLVKDATGSVLRANKRELAFILKIPNSEANLGKVHKTFIDAVYCATDNKVILLASNDCTTPVPAPIQEPKDFPKADSAHRAFFRCHVNQRDTIVYHVLITSISIDELKKQLIFTLQGHNLWMINDSLKAKETSVIAFLWKAPTRMLHHPTFAKKINKYLSKMELNYEQENLLNRTSDDAALPEQQDGELSAHVWAGLNHTCEFRTITSLEVVENLHEELCLGCCLWCKQCSFKHPK